VTRGLRRKEEKMQRGGRRRRRGERWIVTERGRETGEQKQKKISRPK